jgi:predicted transcriptional regulator
MGRTGEYRVTSPHMRLGPLEQRVLNALWSHRGDARVRDLHPSFPELAYTTLMTTLDRLHRKGVLERVAHGRAFAYRARLTRAEAVLSFLVDEVGSLDSDALDALERLVRERRRALEHGHD